MNKLLSSLLLVALFLLMPVATGLAQNDLEPAPHFPIYDPLERYQPLESQPDSIRPLESSPLMQPPFDSYAGVFSRYINGHWQIMTGRPFDAQEDTTLAQLTSKANNINARLNKGATKITFASSNTSGANYEIFKMGADGKNMVQITHSGGDKLAPVWSPDGQKIAYMWYYGGPTEEHADIYGMNVDGSGITRLTNSTGTNGYDGMPSWSPDGTKIAFVSKRTGGYRIWIMNADGSSPVMINSEPYSADPVWSPDGTQILFDADADGDSFQELWLMNADGSNQALLADYTNPGLFFANSWSPDGSYGFFTTAYLTNYNGTYYITSEHVSRIGIQNKSYSNIFYAANETDIDVAPVDALAPASSVTALPAVSPGPVQVTWSGADNGPAGLKNYDIQVQSDGGAWTDWQVSTTTTSASYSGIGGHAYAFRSRSRDIFFNLEPWPAAPDTATTVKSLPPLSWIVPLPAYFRGANLLPVGWSGTDPGNSGIANYDVQYKTGGGNWIDWLSKYTGPGAELAVTPGQSYAFRVRARDNAQNQATYPAAAGQTTLSYLWAVQGRITDNSGTPVSPASLSLDTGASQLEFGSAGSYRLRSFSPADSYSLGASKSGYGPLPDTIFPSWQDAAYDVILPPADDLIQDGGFEAGTGWQTEGTLPIAMDSPNTHSGQKAVQIGLAPTSGIMQQITNNPYDNAMVYEPVVVRGPDDTIYVVWNDMNDLQSQVNFSEQHIASTWHAPVLTLSNPQEAFCYNPDIALSSDGTVHVIYLCHTIQNSKDMYFIRYQSKPTGGNWSAAINVLGTDFAPDLLIIDQPRILVDRQNGIHISAVIHLSNSMALYNLLYRYCRPNGVWSNPSLVALENKYVQMAPSPVMKADTEGNVYFLWGYNQVIYYAKHTPDDTWFHDSYNLVSLPENTGIMPFGIKFELDQGGTVRAIFPDSNGYNYIERSANGVWSRPRMIVPSSFLNNIADWTMVYTALDSSGRFHLAFGLESQTYYASSTGWGDWSVVSKGPSGFLANMTVGTNGAVYVSFTRGDNIHPGGLFIDLLQPGGMWATPIKLTDLAYKAVDNTSLTLDSGNNPFVFLTGNSLYFFPYALAFETNSGGFSQTMTIPTNMASPTLSFMYKLYGTHGAPQPPFAVTVDDGTASQQVFSTSLEAANWTHQAVDMSAWKGQTVTLSLTLQQEAGQPYCELYLDDVTLGSAHPDAWVQVSGPRSARPGDGLTYLINYGNQGGGAAESTTLTITLPAGLVFQDADRAPTAVEGQVLTWNVGAIAPHGGPSSLTLHATRRRKSMLPIVVLTGHGNVPTSVRALKAGAFDFLQKPAPPKVLLERIHAALDSDRQARELIYQRAVITERLADLTPREREVMELLVTGKTSKEIATAMRVSVRTVEGHRRMVLSKMEVSSAAQLVSIVLSVRQAASGA